MLTKNQRGFSLVQVLMAVGIIGGLAVAMQMTGNQHKQEKSFELETEAAEVTTVIRQILSDKEACEATFIGTTPGDAISALRMKADVSQEPFAEAGVKFKNYNVYVKEMRLLSRAEEVTTNQRNAENNPIASYSTGAGLSYLKVVLVKHLGLINDQKNVQKFYGSKETTVILPIKGFFYDMKIITHQDVTKLEEACWANAATLGLSCNGSAKERCATALIDVDKNGTDFVVNSNTGSRSYLAECRYFRDDSPFMGCTI